MTDYHLLRNGQRVRATPKVKGKKAVKAERKTRRTAKREAWKTLRAAKEFANAFPDSQQAKDLAELEAKFGVKVQV